MGTKERRSLLPGQMGGVWPRGGYDGTSRKDSITAGGHEYFLVRTPYCAYAKELQATMEYKNHG